MNADILLFFQSHPDALPLYELLEERLLALLPDVRVKVAKTQLTFANGYGFAFVSFLPVRKAAQRPPVWLTVSFGLPERLTSPRIDAAVEAYPGRWTHHVMIGSAHELNDELLDWLRQAAAFSALKGKK